MEDASESPDKKEKASESPETKEKPLKFQRVKLVLEVLACVAFVVTAICAGLAVFEYKKANKAAARTQLYNTERVIADREIQRPHLQRLYCEGKPELPPEVHVENMLRLCMHGTVDKSLPLSVRANNAKELAKFVWSSETFHFPENVVLRELYIHAETYIYHVHQVWDFKQGGFISEDEWKTWNELLTHITPHPLTMTAIYAAWERKYFSRSFAKNVQDTIKNTEHNRQIVEYFYKELLAPAWLEKFPDYD